MDPDYIQGMASDDAGGTYADETLRDVHGHLNSSPHVTKENPMAKKEVTNPPEVLEAMEKGKSTALVHWKDRMIAIKTVAQDAEKPSGGFISFKGGRMSYGDELLPGDKINAIIVDYRFENDFYQDKYVAGQVKSPACFAITRPGELLSPWRPAVEGDNPDDVEEDADGNKWFSAAEAPKVDPGGECDGCWANEWGSAGQHQGDNSKGKACKTSRRIMILAADDCTSPEKIAKAGVVSMIPPATSVDNFQGAMNQITKVLDTAHFGAIVEISVKPHPKFLFQVHFKVLQQIQNDDILQALMGRYEKETAKSITYPKNSEREDAAPAGKQSGKY